MSAQRKTSGRFTPGPDGRRFAALGGFSPSSAANNDPLADGSAPVVNGNGRKG